MSLIFLALDFPPAKGGIQTVSYELPLALHRAGHEVGVVSMCGAGSEEFDAQCPFPVVRVPEATKSQLAANLGMGAGDLAKQLTEKPVATIATKWFPEGLGATWVLRPFSPPIVMFGHGREFRLTGGNPVKWFLQRWILKQVDLGIGVSQWTARQLVMAGLRKNKVFVVNNGIRPEKFSMPVPDIMDELRIRLQIETKKVLLTTGRLVERKGHDTVLRLLPQIIEQAGPVTYVIVGTGPQEEKLKTLVKTLGISEYVRFAGGLSEDELVAAYHLADIFVMPTRDIKSDPGEGFGIVYLEANASGTPVVATDCGGVADAVADGVSGILCPAGDDQAVADALVKLLLDDELCQHKIISQ